MSSDNPSDSDEPHRGPVRRFVSEFFRSLSFSDWIEFVFYAVAAVGVVAVAVAWLIGRL